MSAALTRWLLRLLLAVIQPGILRWAERLAAEVQRTGVALDEEGVAIARQVGVAAPQRIRIGYVQELPLPGGPLLRRLARGLGMLHSRTYGFTLGHSVVMLQGRDSRKLRQHEFRHVYQYEQAGSIAAFLPGYLRQVVTYGYRRAPLEMDAVAQERDA